MDYNNSFFGLIGLEQKKIESAQLQGFRELIAEQNKNLSRAQNFWRGQISFTFLLEKLFAALPSGIYLKELALVKNNSGAADFSVRALADNMETLFQFLQSLQAVPEFKEIDFSASAWLKPKDIDFLFKFAYAALPK